jgi:Xaa-Pro aminopeptidase
VDHVARRRRLTDRLPELGAEAVLVTRLPNVRYLSGFTGSNGTLVLAPGRGELLTDGRYEEQSAREVPDLDRTVSSGPLVPAVVAALDRLGARRLAFEADGLTYRTFADLGAAGLDLVPASGEVERLRWTKEPEEVALIGEAQAIADESFDVVTGKLVAGVTEREAAFELDVTMRRLGAEALAFDTIMAFGEGAAEPHHRPTDRALRAGDVVKMDFGCVVRGYHSDMTRTIAFGDLDARLRDVYEVVRDAQRAGVEAVRAGTTGGEVDRASRSVIENAGLGASFKHGLGHGVGLEIHEGPALRPGGEDVLPEGAVVTVEPGVYLEGIGGVRIEDMVEVTGDGCRVIPTTAKDLLVLEA